MPTPLRPLVVALCLLLLSACAGLTKDMDPPKVTLESFNALPSEGGAPRFDIKLRIINPNDAVLDIAGISYDIELMGRDMVSGVTNDVPRIGAYSEEVVNLQASLQLFELLRLFASLGTSGEGPLDYRFSAKIDFKGLVPTQRVEESGEINLR